jgi:hypothetical protein
MSYTKIVQTLINWRSITYNVLIFVSTITTTFNKLAQYIKWNTFGATNTTKECSYQISMLPTGYDVRLLDTIYLNDTFNELIYLMKSAPEDICGTKMNMCQTPMHD